MAKSPTVRVTHRPDGKWQYKIDGNDRASKVTDHKKDVIGPAHDAAVKLQAELVIHGKDGQIQSKDSFGKDPCPPRDTEH